MPAATRYIPPTDSNRWPMLVVSQQERDKRKNAYQVALSYYLDDYTRQLLTDDEGLEPDYNVGINLVKMAADRTASFLFPNLPTFEIDPTTPDQTPEEKWITNFIKANGGLQMLHKMAYRGFLSGHNFVRVRNVSKLYRGEIYPTISLLEPSSVTVYWQADDVAQVLWYEQRYQINGNPVIEDHVRSADGKSWRTFTYVRPELTQDQILEQQTSHGISELSTSEYIFWDQGGWEVGAAPVLHPYWVPPVIEWPHLPHPNDFYGQNEFGHQDLLDTINRLWSEISRIVHIHSDPKDVLVGSTPDEVQDEGSLLTVDNPAAKVSRLMLNQGALAETLETVQKLTETFLALSRVVLLKGEAKDLQRVTNASVRTLFLDAISKNYLLQDGYGYGLGNICELGLKMSKLPNRGKNFPIQTKFAEALPIDMLELAQVATQMSQIGAWSKRTIRVKTGVDPVFEANNIRAEQEEDLALQERQMKMEAAAKPDPETPVRKPTANTDVPRG